MAKATFFAILVAGLPLVSALGAEPAMNMANTLSDEAQLNTIAFDGLAFLTGSLGSDSFFPPGKVADFWGFQYLRDNDLSNMGHNTDFLTSAANNMLSVLTADQCKQLVTLATSQVASINEYGYDRFVLMDAFRRNLTGNIPAGSTGLDRNAVKAYSQQLYQLDGQISYDRAKVMGSILHDLTPNQRTYLNGMVGKGMTSWPKIADQISDQEGAKIDKRTLTNDECVAVMTYAGDLFSWYAGNTTADVYFCPERQGTYFGSFYLKDAPAVGNPNYTISTSLTGDMGAAFLNILNPQQRAKITSLVDLQKDDLNRIVDRRDDVADELRKFIAGQTPSSVTVQDLMTKYGEHDGDIVYLYATAFADVAKTLTSEQWAALQDLRTEILTVDGNTFSVPNGRAYLYSTQIDMPNYSNSDSLFAVPEPSTFALLGMGAIGLMGFAWRKRNAA